MADAEDGGAAALRMAALEAAAGGRRPSLSRTLEPAAGPEALRRVVGGYRIAEAQVTTLAIGEEEVATTLALGEEEGAPPPPVDGGQEGDDTRQDDKPDDDKKDAGAPGAAMSAAERRAARSWSAEG